MRKQNFDIIGHLYKKLLEEKNINEFYQLSNVNRKWKK